MQVNDSPQARVIRAVSRGARLTEEIAAKAQLNRSDALTCLRRLRMKGYVRSIPVRRGQSGRLNEYEPVGVTCLMADVWK